MLSYSFRRRETIGFAKGRVAANIAACVADLRACATQVGHPLLLPTIFLSYYLSPDAEIRYRDCRSRLRLLERALSSQESSADGADRYSSTGGSHNIAQINEDITKCYVKMLCSPKPVLRQVVSRLEDASRCFWDHLHTDEKTADMRHLHARMLERLDFHKARLVGIESYASVIMQRLEVQRSAVTRPLTSSLAHSANTRH